MSFPLWLSKRMRLGEGKSRSTGVIIAAAGIAVAICVLEIAVSIVSGFKEQISSKIIGFDSEIAVYPPYNEASGTQDAYIEHADRLADELSQKFPQAEVSATVRQPALIKTDDNFAAIILGGYSRMPAHIISNLKIIDGSWPDFSAQSADTCMVISRDTAGKLGLKTGDRVTVSFFDGEEIKLRRLTISGIYTSNISDFDELLGFASYYTLAKIAGISPSSASRIELRGMTAHDYAPEEIQTIASDLQKDYLSSYYTGMTDRIYTVDNVVRSGANYFNWLALLDTNIVVIIILMVCIAGFTLASSLVMVILERIRVIGVLRAMGCTLGQLRKSLSLMGMKIVLYGLLWGNILGIGLLLLQYHTSAMPLDPQMYYLDYVPVSLTWSGYMIINLGALAVSYLILLVPAGYAARLDPVKSLNYE